MRREGGELVWEQRGLVGVEPPDERVVGGEAVRVLDGELGLADSTQTVQRLQHDPLVGGQLRVELFEHPVPAGEVRVARWHPPHRRPHPREPPDAARARLGPGSSAGERVSLPAAGPRLQPRQQHPPGVQLALAGQVDVR